MTTAPRMKNPAATTSSAVLVRNAARPAGCSDMLSSLPKKCGAPAAGAPHGPALALLAGHEAGGLHQRYVARFLLRHPVGVGLALERGQVERALLHQVLPLRRLL